MDDFLKKFSKASREIRLTDAERSRMRARLERRMTRSTLPSPFIFLGVFRSRTVHYMTATALILTITGSSVSYAAESALPGDMFYPIKTNVTEKARVLVTVDTKSRAALETELALKRLDEAAKLATDGRLTTEAQEGIAANFQAHAANVNATIRTLTHEKKEADAAEMSSNFESSLLAHGAILASIASDDAPSSIDAANGDASSSMSMIIASSSETPEPQPSAPEAASRRKATITTDQPSMPTDTDGPTPLASIVDAVKSEARAAIESRALIEARIKTSEDARTETFAKARRASAQAKLETATRRFESKKQDLSAENARTISERLAVASNLMTQGGAAFDAGDYGDAFIRFQKAERVAHESLIMLKTSNTLRGKPIPASGVLKTSIQDASTTTIQTTKKKSLPRPQKSSPATSTQIRDSGIDTTHDVTVLAPEQPSTASSVAERPQHESSREEIGDRPDASDEPKTHLQIIFPF